MSSVPALAGSSQLAGLATQSTAPTDDARRKLWNQSQDFETVFVETMFEHLTSGLSGDGPLGAAGAGGEVYRGMLTQQYAKATVAAGGVGIAPDVYRELVKLQESQSGSANHGQI